MKEWLMEPNEKSFEHRGYQCYIRRSPHLLTLCGYVAVPFHVENYNELSIECHGGLSFFGDLNQEVKNCIGFDCAHYGDFIPGVASLYSRGMYRTIAYVETQCRHVVDQLVRYKDLADQVIAKMNCVKP